jgi:hypothetical protein
MLFVEEDGCVGPSVSSGSTRRGRQSKRIAQTTPMAKYPISRTTWCSTTSIHGYLDSTSPRTGVGPLFAAVMGKLPYLP